VKIAVYWLHKNNSTVKKEKISFCSQKCYQEWGKIGTKILVQCSYCEKSFYKHPSLVRDTNNFCNMKCSGKWRSINIIGENHPNWKENPDYQSLHSWVYDNFGKANKCEMSGCKYPRVGDKGIILKKPKRYEWSNKTGIYNRERKNWWQLCPSCHRKYDYKNNIRKNKNV